MDKSIFLQTFVMHLQRENIVFKQQHSHIRINQVSDTKIAEFFADDQGNFEASVVDLVHGKILYRQQGQWQDANQLIQQFQTFRKQS